MTYEQDKKYLSRQEGFEHDKKGLSMTRRIGAGQKEYEQDKNGLSRQEGFELDKKDLRRSRRIVAGQEFKQEKKDLSGTRGFEQDKKDLSRTRRNLCRKTTCCATRPQPSWPHPKDRHIPSLYKTNT